MKKILCLVISLIVLLSSISALAEEFTIHSGVMFGMSIDEVISAETASGFPAELNDEGNQVSFEGTVAGYGACGNTHCIIAVQYD